MAAVCGIVSLKSFTYRGARETTSNDYWFTGSIPADSTAWRALYDALVAQEKTLVNADFHHDGAYGYDSDADGAAAVWSIDMTVSPNTPVNGTYANSAGDPRAPGDAAAWVRWKVNRLTSKGKPIYLRKYFHGVYHAGTGGIDTIAANQLAAYDAFGAKMMDGSFIDGRKLRSRKNNDTLAGHATSSYITTRTLKRRGKRPGA